MPWSTGPLFWPTPADAAAAMGLPAAAVDDPAWVMALAAAQAEVIRLAPRRVWSDGPADQAVSWAVQQDAAGLYRARGGDSGVLGPDGFDTAGLTPSDFPTVRRLLGVGYYARPVAR